MLCMYTEAQALAGKETQAVIPGMMRAINDWSRLLESEKEHEQRIYIKGI